ncbi:MAG TPA: VOC family protein [Egibacteraceae bacterium]|nr:VOC family protein [Egibacteraceae bacterium]
MRSSVRTVTVDCNDTYALAAFWSQVFATPMHPDDEPGDPEALVDLGPGQPGLLFVAVPEAKTGKNRLHLDLQPDHPRDAEIERLLRLGAVLVADRRRTDGTGWAVLADIEGNEFCVLMSAAERAAADVPPVAPAR